MDATLFRWVICTLVCCSPLMAEAATRSTPNFVVTAPSEEVAQRVANCAEFWRRELAEEWLGRPLPNWFKACPITVTIGSMGASGQTTFTFEKGEVFGWKMQVQGSLERVLDSVVPHEVSHTIFASHFRRPLPRWADEGAATLVEHESEKLQQRDRLNRVIHSPNRIPLKTLLAIREYPQNHSDVLTLYAEGYSLAEFLVNSKGSQGRGVFLKFLEDAHRQGWDKAVSIHYGFENLNDLESSWTNWIIAGSPAQIAPAGEMLADASQTRNDAELVSHEDTAIVRSQSPELDEPAPLDPIPRKLRATRPTGDIGRAPAWDSRDTSAAGEAPERTAAVWDGRVSSARTARDEHAVRELPERLTPTAGEISTSPRMSSYAFPASR